jgi:putative FmdB family regulatory protein
MPIYTYECEDCGVRFDARQKFSDDPISECPECGGYTHRVPQPVGIVFKGSGWYVKDSKGRNNLSTSPKQDKEKESGTNGQTDAAKPAKKDNDTPKSDAKPD